MKLYNGTGEYIAAWDVKSGDLIRGKDRRVRRLKSMEIMALSWVVLFYEDDVEEELPGATRVLKVYEQDS